MTLEEAIRRRQLRPLFVSARVPPDVIRKIIAAGLSGIGPLRQSGIEIKGLDDSCLLNDLSNKASRWIKAQYEGMPKSDPIRSVVFDEAWHPLNHAPALLIVTSDGGPRSEVSSAVAQNLTLACNDQGLAVRSLAFLLDWLNTAQGKRSARLPAKINVEAVIAIGTTFTSKKDKPTPSGKMPPAEPLFNTVGTYHLTPSGWQREDTPPYPEDRVETLLCEMGSQDEGRRKLPVFTCLWRSPRPSRSEIDTMHSVFGEVPERLQPAHIPSR